MGAEETKQDLMLKRTQVTIGILVGVASLIVAVYNVKNNVLSDKSPGKISVTVVSEDSRQPVVGARVEFLNSQSALIATAATGADGQVISQDLGPGSYAVKIARSGFEPELATVQVNPRRTTDVALVLRALAQGQKNGDPIRSAFEEVGASWIKKIGQPRSEPAQDTAK